MIIGLTGGIGSGKTTVAKLFAACENVVVYIADFEAKKLMNTSPVLKSKIIAAFGKESFENNILNKAFIANIVFKNPAKLSLLNAIVHPVVKNHFKDFREQHKNATYILYENAILFETKSNLFCDIVITVSAPLTTRIKRVILRDNVSEQMVRNRIKNQWIEDKKLLQSNYLIENITLKKVQFQVSAIHKILTKNFV